MVIENRTRVRGIACRWFGWLVLGWLAGCATGPAIYDPIRDAGFQGPTLAAVRERPEVFLQTRVRWGGTIARVDNQRKDTWLEIVEHPLEDYGRPILADNSAGRFLAQVPVFLDPAIYAVGRPITMVGLVSATTAGQVGKYRYTYPVVVVEHHRLWSERRGPDVIYVPDPFWPGPGYGPFYPWGYRPGPFW
ncbi:MAG TPA: Slp family lipoprotein [Candidatus Competibacter sp.]|nr:hypothetical protein [Candidatus Competibacteraceae bacterium]HRC73621.1 Slp family lipoprotein [Candidatus Competibacter sp.]